MQETGSRASTALAALGAGWAEALAPCAGELTAYGGFLRSERAAGQTVYPPGPAILRAFVLTPFEAVRVVLLGQDPYHGPGQAMGLSFSVPPGVAVPASLRNIFRELASDVGVEAPRNGDLTPWAERGVLLLNSALTVRAGQAGSHRGKGSEAITRGAVRALGERDDPCVWILWGRHAQDLAAGLPGRHPTIASVHPSPLAASGGFFGSRPFSRANAALERLGREPIDWSLP